MLITEPPRFVAMPPGPTVTAVAVGRRTARASGTTKCVPVLTTGRHGTAGTARAAFGDAGAAVTASATFGASLIAG